MISYFSLENKPENYKLTKDSFLITLQQDCDAKQEYDCERNRITTGAIIMNQTDAAIIIQKTFRGYRSRRELIAVKDIFHRIEQEIHYQVLGPSRLELEKKIKALEEKRMELVAEQDSILQAFSQRIRFLKDESRML